MKEKSISKKNCLCNSATPELMKLYLGTSLASSAYRADLKLPHVLKRF